MSQEIDEKVVEMRFDNKQFEREASTTMTTLQKLKKHLDFSKVGDSFDAIDKASRKVDMNGLGSAITSIESKFSALEVMAITTLSNITNSVINAGKRWLSAFTIEPIKSGFQEYETQINAVQTILANTQKEGTNIKDVNKALDELNLYADKTIYNFTEMTRNIGTFTAAGIKLDTSVNAIQGIANLAAVSGSTSQQASTAMYQLSQALATGTVKLMDWNSVVNAGMGGQVFQDALRETSQLLGTGAEAAIKANGSFRESLQAGWLTSEVLTETLKKFTTSGAVEYVSKYTGLAKEAVQEEWNAAKAMYGEAEAIDKAAEALAKKSGKNKDEIAETLKFAQTAEDAATKVKTFSQLIDTLKEAVQSGWSQSFRIIIGDFEEAKELFTEISDSFGAVISASADARNQLLAEVFNKTDAQDYISNIVGVSKEAVGELQTIGKEAGVTSDVFKETLNVFTNGDKSMNEVVTHLVEMANSEKDVISYMSDITGMKEDSLRELQNLGKEVGYTSDEFKELANVLAEGDPEMQATITHLLEMNEAIQKPSGRELLIDSLKNGMKGLISVVKPVQQAFREVFPPATADQVYGMLEAFNNFTKTLTLSEKSSENVRKAFKGVFDVIKLLGDGFGALVKLIIPVEKPITSLAGGLLEIAGAGGETLSFFSNWIRNSPRIAKAYDVVSDSVNSAITWLGNMVSGIDDFAMEVYKMEETQKILRAISRAFEAAGEAGKIHITALINKIKEFGEYLNKSIPDKAKNSFETFSKAVTQLADDLDNIDFSKSEEWFNKLKEAIDLFMKTITDNNGSMTFIENAKNYGSKLQKAFSFDTLVENIETCKKTINGFVDWMKKHVAPFFEDFSIGGVAAGGAGIGIVYAFIKMAKGFESLTGTFKAIPDLLDGVKGSIEAYQKDLNASALLKTAGAIGILAGALVLLSFTDTKQLLKAALALSIVGSLFFAGVSVLSNALNKGKGIPDVLNTFAKGLRTSMKNLSKAVKYKAVGSMFKDISNSIIKVAIAIVAMGYVYTKHEEYIKNGAKVVGAIAGVMVGIIAAMSILGNKVSTGMNSFAKASFGIAALAVSLSIITSSLSSFLNITLPDDWKKKFEIISALLFELGALTVVIGLANRLAGSGSLKTGPIIATVLGVAALTLVLTQLFKIDLPNDWKRKINILNGIFVSFGALMLVIGAASKIAGGKIKATGTILAMCAFIATATASLLILSMVPWDRLVKGSVALGSILITLGVALVGAGKVADESASKAVMSMAVTVGVITASLAVLSLLPINKMLPAAITLGTMLSILAVDFNYISKTTNEKAWLTVLAMVGAVAMIAAALIDMSKLDKIDSMLASAIALGGVLLAYAQSLKIVSSTRGIKLEKIGLFLLATLAVIPIGTALGVLAHQPWDGMLAAGLAMSGTLLVFAQTMKMISAMRGIKLEKIGVFLLATLSMAPIGIALGVLAHQPWTGLLAAGTAISAVVLSIAGAMSLMSVFKPNLGAIAAFGLGVVAVAGVAASLYFLSQQPTESLLASALAISGVLLAMSGAMAVATVVGAAAGPAIAGLGVLVLFIAGFTAVLVALGALFNSPEAQTLLSGGAEILAQIGYALGDFVGSIAGGFLGGLSSSLPAIGENLSAFMSAAAPFFEGAKSIDPASMQGIKYMAEAFLLLTGGAILDGLTSWLTGGTSVVEFGKQLAEFGPYFKQYCDSVQGIDASVVEASANAALVLADMASKLPNSGGLAGKIFGENNLSDFAKELAIFGPIIKQYSMDVSGLDASAVEASANAAKLLSDMASGLPNSGGLAGKIFGENNLSDFGKELAKFGPIIKQYSLDVAGLDGTAVEASANAARIMSDMATNLPNSGGLAAKILGENTLSMFGEELKKFGPAIAAYSQSVSGLDASVVTNSANAAMALASLANNLPNSGGLVSWFTGDNDIASFGQSLVSFGSSMKSYYDSVSQIDSTQLTNVVTEFKNLVDLANTVSGVDTTGMTNFVTSLGNMGTTGVTAFIEAFTNSYSTVTTTINTFVTTATNALQLKTTIFTQKGTAAVTAYLNAIKLKYPEATLTGTTLANNVLTAIALILPQFNVKGLSAANQFLTGIKSKYPEATTTGRTLANNALAGCQSLYSSFYTAGANAGQGFVDGLKSKMSSASAAGKAIGEAAYKAAKEALDINSPSRKMEELGDYSGIGFVNRLMQYVSKAYEAGKEIGNSVLDGANKAINDISEVFTSDLSSEPIITPHVDMSEVTKSADDINRLFNQAIALTSKQAGSVSTNFAQRRNNNLDDEFQNGRNSQKPTIINNNNFEQNNYSPKALSRIEIYRQTNNQFSRFTEAVNKS